MNFSALVTVLILCVLAGLTTLILTIIFLASSKNRNALVTGVTFIMILAGAILCIMEITARVRAGVNELTENIHSGADSLKSELETWGDSLRVHFKEHSALHDSLQSYLPTEVKDTLGASFWKSDHHHITVMALTWPYQLEAEASLESGGKIICYSKKNCLLDKAGISPENITRINLDRHFILFKKDNTLDGSNHSLTEPDVLYVLFDLRSGSTRSFLNENQLLQQAVKAGYTGRRQLLHLHEYRDAL
jgi:hypothetical protein